ncbi:MAG TPA: AGE family epimerase/isomerase [Anaerolineales bacterium]|nr:AGE family epimerase/isomerase [Anaerolineales bacterium]
MTDDLKRCIEQELTDNILPFWAQHTLDAIHGGFYGALSNDLKVNNEAPRSAVLYGRILWTFSLAFRKYKKPEYLSMARRAYDYLCQYFWDKEYYGVYWTVNAQGQPIEARKHAYAQAFFIYGLTEYHLATGEAEPLTLARRVFDLLEAHYHDSQYGGYIEGRGRDWVSPANQRLSDLEPISDKSMNTLLHVLEAFTSLARVWDEPKLRARLKELIEIFLDRVIDSQTHHFRLFFCNDWSWDQPEPFSYGHDIEGSWLLVEAAEALGDKALLERARDESVQMAQAVYAEALQADGRMISESAGRPHSRDLNWWTHAEAVVGFYNAYQISGQERFAEASKRVWNFIQNRFVDHQFGDWFKNLDTDANPYPNLPKVGPWECPYHHSRACFEMMNRLP